MHGGPLEITLNCIKNLKWLLAMVQIEFTVCFAYHSLCYLIGKGGKVLQVRLSKW